MNFDLHSSFAVRFSYMDIHTKSQICAYSQHRTLSPDRCSTTAHFSDKIALFMQKKFNIAALIMRMASVTNLNHSARRLGIPRLLDLIQIQTRLVLCIGSFALLSNSARLAPCCFRSVLSGRRCTLLLLQAVPRDLKSQHELPNQETVRTLQGCVCI